MKDKPGEIARPGISPNGFLMQASPCYNLFGARSQTAPPGAVGGGGLIDELDRTDDPFQGVLFLELLFRTFPGDDPEIGVIEGSAAPADRSSSPSNRRPARSTPP